MTCILSDTGQRLNLLLSSGSFWKMICSQRSNHAKEPDAFMSHTNASFRPVNVTESGAPSTNPG
jgi:hypothetical protein